MSNNSYFGGIAAGLKTLAIGLKTTMKEYFTPKSTEQYPENRKTTLHVSRPMHWDSDHVTLFDDNTRNLFSELVRANRCSSFYDSMFALTGWKTVEINGIEFELNSILVEKWKENRIVLSYRDKGE